MQLPAKTSLPLKAILPGAAAGLLLLAHFAPTLHAADAAPPHPSPRVAAPQTVTYAFGAAQWLNAPRSVEMTQGVTFGQDDATLKTEAAVALLDKEQHLLSAQAAGPVHIFDPQDDLTGLHGRIDFTRHLATLESNIVLQVKPGKREGQAAAGSPRKQFKDPATLTCQAMTWDYRRKIGRVPGALKVVQVIQTKDGPETRTLTADAGLYNGRLETIQLVGTVHLQTSAGDVFTADTRPSGKPVVIGTREGAEFLHIDFPSGGILAVRPEDKEKNATGQNAKGGSGKDTVQDNTDDTDLTVPAPPPTKAPAAPASPAPDAAPPAGTAKL